MNKIIIGVMGVVLALTMAQPSLADKNHKEKARITNNTGVPIKIERFNGNDSSCNNDHGEPIYIHDGETKPIRCHPKGKNRCKISVLAKKDNNREWYYVKRGLDCQKVKGDCDLTMWDIDCN